MENNKIMFPYFLILFILRLNSLLNVECAVSGLISPIEVVEEWGCQDTEIRLTCGFLNTQMAILDATFTPNCSDTDQDCAKLDDKRLIKAYAPHKLNPHWEEAKAGRRFLETLRSTNDDFYINDDPDDDIETIFHFKEKKVSLKASLEMLLVRYLKKLTPDNENDIDYDRYRRNIVNYTFNSDNINFTEIDDYESSNNLNNDNIETVKIFDDRIDYTNSNDYTNDSKIERIVLGSRNINVSEEDYHKFIKDNEKKENSAKKEKSICMERKRRIAQLDRFELDKSVEEDGPDEFNIRSVVNRRCSGKNHCSFIFSLDHPFAIVWPSGTVRIKYVCMDEYRINKYCSERLIIGNENELQNRNSKKMRKQSKGEPIAEARVQLESNFHQFTNLKILKSEKNEDELNEDQRIIKENAKRKKQRIYSQDFRVIKILKDVGDFNDIEQIGDEFYFKNKDSEVEKKLNGEQEIEVKPIQKENVEIKKIKIKPPPLSEISPVTPPTFYKKLTTIPFSTSSTTKIPFPPFSTFSSYIQPTKSNFKSKEYEISNITDKENVTINLTKDNEIEVDLEKFNELPKLISTSNESTSSIDISYKSELTTITTTTTTKESNLDMNIDKIITTTTLSDDKENDVSDGGGIDVEIEDNEIHTNDMNISNNLNQTKFNFNLNNKISKFSYNNSNDVEVIHSEMTSFNRNDKTVIKSDVIYDDFDENDDDDDDDLYYNENDYNYMEYPPKRKKKYKSIQRTALKKPLVHGFIMSPGYPKYYIGESECKWYISAPREQKIRITFIDISLRVSNPCRDYLEVIDIQVNRTLFSSCQDNIKPIEIISESNQIQVILKTTTKVLYPKRGILFHYTALGCLIPTTPLHANLIERKEEILKYECDTLFVFPDTAIPIRELKCTSRHTWDQILPDCIEQKAVEGSGLVQRFDQTKEASIMVNAYKTDMLYDIIIPSIIIAGLFILNTIIFLIIMRYRNKRKDRLEFERNELAEL